MESQGTQSPLPTPGETANQQKTRTHAECSTRGSNPVLQQRGLEEEPASEVKQGEEGEEGEAPSLNQDGVRLSLEARDA